MGRKIDVMIIGAQKAGTTSLKNYLFGHPDVLSHHAQEFGYFVVDEEYARGPDVAWARYLQDKPDTQARVVLAKSASLYATETWVERLFGYNPDCRLVFLLREPVSRAISAYNMERFSGWLKRDFGELRSIIEHKQFDDLMYRLFIGYGLYAERLRTIRSFFPQEQMKIIQFEHLKSRPEEVYTDLCHWLGISDDFKPDFNIVHNRTSQARSRIVSRLLLRRKADWLVKPLQALLPTGTLVRWKEGLLNRNKSNRKPDPIDPGMRTFLHAYFESHNRELEEMTGLDLSAWNK